MIGGADVPIEVVEQLIALADSSNRRS